MTNTCNPSDDRQLVFIEPDDRLVVLARVINARNSSAENSLKSSANFQPSLTEACLGKALYRHRTFFKNAAKVSAWSYLELSYFRSVIPKELIFELVFKKQPEAIELLRAEILLTTPSSFILPLGWRDSTDKPGCTVSLEYIQVETPSIEEYRDVMRDYCGAAAAKLVQSGKFGTFRAMETAAVLYQAPELGIDWNQIHLCELEADNFNGFGQEFEAALRDESSKASDTSGIFSNLDRIRSVPCWTFNDPVVEENKLASLSK